MSDTVVGGRYRLGTRLGVGGMGRVWLALDQVLHRSVAVKEVLLPEGLAEAELHELRVRTVREARTAARLSHPNVVRVYDAIYDDGRPWIVMEYVPSRSLGQILTEHGPLTPERTARVGLALVGALTAAHRAGVLHRDVKPGNVLLADDGRVMLTDFGLATFDEVGAPLTQSGVVLGSPQFIAPERAQDGTSSPEADLWSLGATLYAAVEGRSPYSRSNSWATLTALATADPDPPRRAGDLKPVLMGLLKRDPAARMPADEVHDRLSKLAAADAGRGWFVPRPRTGNAPGHSGDLADAADPNAGGGTRPASDGGTAPPAGGSAWGRTEWPTPDPFEPVTTAFLAPGTPAPPAWPAPANDSPLSVPPPPYPTPPGEAETVGLQPRSSPISGGPISGGPVSGGPISGGPISGGPVSGGPISGGPVSGMSDASASSMPVPVDLPRRPRHDQPPGWPSELLDRATPPEPFATFDAAARRGAPPDPAVPTDGPRWSDAPSAPTPVVPDPAGPPPAIRSLTVASTSPVPSRPPSSAPPVAATPSVGTVRPESATLPRGRRRKPPARRFGVGAPAIFVVLLLLVAGVIYIIDLVGTRPPASPAAAAHTSPPGSPPPQNQFPPPDGHPPPPGPPPAHLSWMCTPTPPFVTKDIPPGPPADNTAGLTGTWIVYTGLTGYQMIVPQNWRMAPDDNTICFYALDNSRLIGINEWTVTTNDPVTALRDRETAMRNDGGLPMYHLLGMIHVPCAVKCAEWDYLYDGPIGRLHVRVRDYLDADGRAFGLTWATMEDAWDTDEPIYEAMVDAFRYPKK